LPGGNQGQLVGQTMRGLGRWPCLNIGIFFFKKNTPISGFPCVICGQITQGKILGILPCPFASEGGFAPVIFLGKITGLK